MTDSIDWGALAERLREVDARPEFASTVAGARHTVEILIGVDRLRLAVDEYVADDRTPASDVIELVLTRIWPPSAAARCYEISRSGADTPTRQAAVYLLGKTADRRALPWIGELLDDPEREIRGAGIDVLDRLLWGCEVDADDCEGLLRRAETDRDSQVRSAAARIREDVSRRRGIVTDGTPGLAIATQRRETLVGLNATHYFSLVVARTFYHRGHRDRVLVQKASLSYGSKVERTLLRETFTDESDAVQETRRLAFDLAAYMAAQGVTPSLGIVRWVEDYDWGVDDDGLFIEDSAASPTRAIVVPMRTLRRLLPQVSRDTRVVEAFAESGAYFALLQEGRAAWHADVFQKRERPPSSC